MNPEQSNPSLENVDQLVNGDPIHYLLNTFHTLYPDIKVKVVYVANLEPIASSGVPVESYEELPEVFVNEPSDTETLAIEDRDENYGSYVGIIKAQDQTFILLDYQNAVFENLQILLDALPRLVSNPENGVMIGNQFKYRVARKRVENLFDAVMQNFYENALPNLFQQSGVISVVHSNWPSHIDTVDSEDDGTEGDLV